MELTWESSGRYGFESTEAGGYVITFEPRPAYCDRGRFVVKAFNAPGHVNPIDWADAFPRYYMDEARAKAEIADWLAFRIAQDEARAALPRLSKRRVRRDP